VFDAVVRYRFGLRITDFLLCSRCGVFIGAQITTPSASSASSTSVR